MVSKTDSTAFAASDLERLVASETAATRSFLFTSLTPLVVHILNEKLKPFSVSQP